MKKRMILLAGVLILSGCAAKPVDAPVQSLPPAISESAASENASSGPAAGPNASSLPEMPVPDLPPATEVGAMELPAQTFTSSGGYGLEVLTPAQYDAYLDIGRGGYKGFLSSDLFKLGQGGKYAVANAMGKIVTDFVYDADANYWSATEGMALLVKDGKAGAVYAADGVERVPFQYDFVWPVLRSELVRAQTGDKIEILDRAGKAVFTLERGDDIYATQQGTLALLQDGTAKFYNLSDYSPIGNFSAESLQVVGDSAVNDNGLFSFQVNEKWGFCDAYGKIIADPVYDEAGYFQGDYAAIKRNGKKGVLRQDGKVVVKPEWDDLVVYKNSVTVCKDGKWGAITDVDSGKVSIDLMYDYVYGFGADGTACYERGGKYGVIDRDGNQVIMGKYDGEISSVYANLDKGYYLLDGGNGPGSRGVIGGGKEILSTDHVFIPQGINPYTAPDEKYNLVMTPRGKWGYVDGTGTFVIDAKFDEADGFIAGKNVAFVKQDGKMALIDRKGNPVVSTVFSDLIAFNPDTMVCAMEYTNDSGEKKTCLVKILLPA